MVTNKSLQWFDFSKFYLEHIVVNEPGRARVFELEDFISGAKERVRKIEIVQAGRKPPAMFVGDAWAREARSVPSSDLIWMRRQISKAEQALIKELKDPASEGLIDNIKHKPRVHRPRFINRDDLIEQLAHTKKKGRKDYKQMAKDILDKKRKRKKRRQK